MDAAPPTRPRTRPGTRPNTGPGIADRKTAFRRFAIGSVCFGAHILSVAAFLLMVTVGGLHWLLAEAWKEYKDLVKDIA